MQPCWTFAYASPPQVQGDGGEKVGHQALALKVAGFTELAEDSSMTLNHLDQIMPYRFLMAQAELAYVNSCGKMARGASADAGCTALVAQESTALVAQDPEQATLASVMLFF